MVWGAQWLFEPQTAAGFSGWQVPLLELELDELEDDELDELDELELVDDELLLEGVQMPLWHSSSPMHSTPQLPQLLSLDMTSMQIPPQNISLGAQLVPPVPVLVLVLPPTPLVVDVEVLVLPP